MDVSFSIILFIFFVYFPTWYPFIPARQSYHSPVNPNIHENIGPKKVYLNILLWLPFFIGTLFIVFFQTLSTVLWVLGGITVLGMILMVLIGTGGMEKLVRGYGMGKSSFDESYASKVKRFFSFVCLICLICGVSAICFKIIGVNLRQEKLLDDLVNPFLLWDYGIAILYMMYCGLVLLLAKKVFK